MNDSNLLVSSVFPPSRMLLPNVRDPRRGSPPSIQGAGWSSVRLPFACSCVIYSSFCLFPQRPDERISFFPPLPRLLSEQLSTDISGMAQKSGISPGVIVCALLSCSVQLLQLRRPAHPLDAEGSVWGEGGPALCCRARLCTGFVYTEYTGNTKWHNATLPEKNILRKKLLVGFAFERAWISNQWQWDRKNMERTTPPLLHTVFVK